MPLPANLMSHNDQQSTWQAGAAEGARRGWGGLMADQYLSTNGSNSVFTAISTAGNAVLLAGQSVSSTRCRPARRRRRSAINAGDAPTTTVFGAANGGARVREIIRDTRPQLFHAGPRREGRPLDGRGRPAQRPVRAGAPAHGVPAPDAGSQPDHACQREQPLAVQLQTVAKVIAANQALGLRRQVFFVSIGGFDNHDVQNTAQSPLMARLAHALAYFDGALANLNGVDMRPQVTTFTASDFSRTFTTNGDGTDHAWGSHQFVMGGDVNGGNVYGQFPTVGIDVTNGFQNPDMSGNILIPTMSVDQYAGTIGRWFGLTDGQLDPIFPNLRNFTNRNVGFMAAPSA